MTSLPVPSSEESLQICQEGKGGTKLLKSGKWYMSAYSYSSHAASLFLVFLRDGGFLTDWLLEPIDFCLKILP